MRERGSDSQNFPWSLDPVSSPQTISPLAGQRETCRMQSKPYFNHIADYSRVLFLRKISGIPGRWCSWENNAHFQEWHHLYRVHFLDFQRLDFAERSCDWSVPASGYHHCDQNSFLGNYSKTMFVIITRLSDLTFDCVYCLPYINIKASFTDIYISLQN